MTKMQQAAELMELDTSDLPEFKNDWQADYPDTRETSPEPQRATQEDMDDYDSVFVTQDAGELILDGYAQPEAGEIPGPPPTSPAAAAEAEAQHAGGSSAAEQSSAAGADAGVGASADCGDSRRPSDEDSCATGTTVAQEKISSDSEKNNSRKNSRDENFSAFVNLRLEVRERLGAKREIVAEQSVEVHRLKERHKSAKDALKESTAELSGLERQWDELCRLLESGEWEKREWGQSEGQAKAQESSTDTTPPTLNAPSPSIDLAATTPLSSLGLTPGRLETIEQATVPGTSRNCATVADLEELLRSGRLQLLKGFGPKAVDIVTDRLREWRLKNPQPEGTVEQVPLIDGKYDPAAWTAGKIAAADGKIRDANPHAIVGAAEWQGNPLWVAWDAGWCQGVRDRGLNPGPVHPALTGTTTPAGIAANQRPVTESEWQGGGSVAADVDRIIQATEATTEPTSSAVYPTESGEPSEQDQAQPAEDQELSVKQKRKRTKKPDTSTASEPTPDSSNPLVAAYNAGCEAALANQPVSSNPYKRGTELWQAFDRGWQETFQGDELE